MDTFVLSETRDDVAVVTLNRPQVLNAWHKPMRDQLRAVLTDCDGNGQIRAIVLTGAGDRAFSAGQDLEEARHFGATEAESWIREFESLYGCIRSLGKPTVAALNGVAAGSAFQFALLTDFRIGHDGVKLGQTEINSGIASVTGPWILREHIGLARTIDLVLTGRLVDAAEAHKIGIINRLVPKGELLDRAVELAHELGAKNPLAMRLARQRFREMTEPGFRDCIEASVRIHGEAYGSGEPARMIKEFYSQRQPGKK